MLLLSIHVWEDTVSDRDLQVEVELKPGADRLGIFLALNLPWHLTGRRTFESISFVRVTFTQLNVRTRQRGADMDMGGQVSAEIFEPWQSRLLIQWLIVTIDQSPRLAFSSVENGST